MLVRTEWIINARSRDASADAWFQVLLVVAAQDTWDNQKIQCDTSTKSESNDPHVSTEQKKLVFVIQRYMRNHNSKAASSMSRPHDYRDLCCTGTLWWRGIE